MTVWRPVPVNKQVTEDYRSALFFIQILYRLFESYVYHVAAYKLANLPTKMAASSDEWC